ncbi:MAG: NAD(P)/FAD-dependent oxidoreductase [Firmicutes bacterium]|nr:NAD(P)/FAD-dependent oxidoreductase [Bacillota bacterium]
MVYDVIIIGAGVVGCAIARELSRFDLSVAVLEKGNDVALGASKANSGLVHAGYDAKPGTFKARFNLRGNELISELSKKLGFHYRKTGAYVLCFSDDGMSALEDLKKRGEVNGVKGLEILDGNEVRKREPNVSLEVVAALYAPSAGIVCPYEMTLALAENAAENGAEFFFLQEVCEVVSYQFSVVSDKEGLGVRGQGLGGTKNEKQKTKNDGLESGENHNPQSTIHNPQFLVKTTSDTLYRARSVVNAAGIYADKIHNMACADKIEIIPRRGEYCLFDRTSGDLTSATLFQLPDKMGKGIMVSPTVDGNLLIGPSADIIDDKDDVSTTRASLDSVLARGARSVHSINRREIIAEYAGLRAHLLQSDDFLVGETEVPGFFDAAGIDSPGLTAAPAIGEFLAGLIAEKLGLRITKNEKRKTKNEGVDVDSQTVGRGLAPAENDLGKEFGGGKPPPYNPESRAPTPEPRQFIDTRKRMPRFSELDDVERRDLVSKNPQWGKIVCRCESVTEAEIVAALHSHIPAVDLDGIKRRARAQMGRCQGGFCAPEIVEIIARERGIEILEVEKAGGATVLEARNKE